MIESLAASPVVHAIGLALVEFLWQGAAIGAVGTLLLFGLRRARAEARYVVACAALACMAAAPAVNVAAHLSDPAFAGRVARTTALWASAGARDDAGTASAVAGDGKVSVAPRGSSDATVATNARAALASAYLRLPLIVLLWSVGVLALTAHLLRGWLVVRRLRLTASDLATGRWPSILASLAERLGVRRRVRLIESARASVPFVVGWLRPVIVVPASALAGLPPAHLEAILTHELIHVRRGDYLVNVTQCVVEILLFYHPAVWWISRQIRIEREHCCDDLAVAASIDRRSYAQALASLEILRRHRPALATAADGGDLLVRVRRLMLPGSVSTPTISGGLAMCTLLTILLLTVGGPLSGMPADREQSGSDPTVSRTPPPTPQVTRRIVLVPPTEPSTGQSATTPVQPRAAAQVRGARPAAVAAASAASTPADRAATPSPAATPVMAIREIVAVSPTAAATTAPTQSAVTVARATLSGVVTDQQGGRLVGATVTLGRTGGGTRTVPTNVVGEFAMSDLIPGDYELGVTLAGFKSYRAPVVAVTSPGVALRVQLQLGGVAESITVSPARAPGPAAVRPSAEALTRYFEALAALREAAQDLRPPVTPEIVPPASVAVPSGTAPRPVRIGGAVAPPQKIRDVRPIYPAELLGTGTQGVVVIEATIGTDGTVQQARILRSASAFDQAALTAVNQWVYSPGRLNGVPVDVTMTVSVRFEQ